MLQKIDNKLNGYLVENRDFDHLSLSVREKLNKWDGNKQQIVRPDWNSYFMAHAFLASTRSCDARTKTGAVIINSSNEIISEGFNSFIRRIDDRLLPNYDADKYDWMQHAELNALLNAARQGKATIGGICYITGKPCLACAQAMWQAGISKIFYGNKYIQMCDGQDYKDNMEIFNWLINKEMPMIHIDFGKEQLNEIIDNI